MRILLPPPPSADRVVGRKTMDRLGGVLEKPAPVSRADTLVRDMGGPGPLCGVYFLFVFLAVLLNSHRRGFGAAPSQESACNNHWPTSWPSSLSRASATRSAGPIIPGYSQRVMRRAQAVAVAEDDRKPPPARGFNFFPTRARDARTGHSSLSPASYMYCPGLDMTSLKPDASNATSEVGCKMRGSAERGTCHSTARKQKTWERREAEEEGEGGGSSGSERRVKREGQERKKNEKRKRQMGGEMRERENGRTPGAA
ncbi:hypothetical protein VTK73DRAFT_2145 [Phialemonium thermophilum]|uniref:Uncharacterized protein n=1 Tax=Phialemonium thermophilum TaxID=223376 RepID=A0ABR3VSP3_9PEZI